MPGWLLTSQGRDILVGEDAHKAQSKMKSHQSVLDLLPVSLAIRDPALKSPDLVQQCLVKPRPCC